MLYNEKIFKRCFDQRGKRFLRNIKYIPLYFRLMRHLTKYGYDEYAEWETYDWFTDTMRTVLTRYRKNHKGSPILIDGFPADTRAENYEAKEKENRELWDGIIDKMIALLNGMDENNAEYDGLSHTERMERMNAAKTEFFGLFSKYFYYLWD